MKLEGEELIYGDKNMIGTVFRNLLSNAVKFSKKNDTIEIGKVEERDKIGIYIKDNGKGISKEKIKEIIEGTNLETIAGTAGEKGSGLGLVLVRDVLNKNNGELRIESQEGTGSCFSILFDKKM